MTTITPTIRPTTTGHLRALFGRLPDEQVIATTVKIGKRWPSKFWAPSEIDAAAAWCTEQAQRGDVYVRATTLDQRPQSHQRGTAEMTGAVVALWADLDVAGPGHAPAAEGALPLPPNRDTVLRILATMGVTPSMLIHTGGGLHAWWLLANPWIIDGPDDRDAAGRLTARWNDGIVERFRLAGWRSDHGVGDLARVLRVCGTWRRKPGVEPNRVDLADCGVWPVGLVDDPDWRPGPLYDLAQLEAAIIEPEVPKPSSSRSALPEPAPAGRTGTTRSTDDYGPANAVSEAMSWAQILEPAGWTFTGYGRVGGEQVELWLRPGDPSSEYSIKCFAHGPCVVWSSGAGLPAGPGQKLNKWKVMVALHFGGDASAAGREIRLLARAVAA